MEPFSNPSINPLAHEWMDALIYHHPTSSGVDGVLRILGLVHLYGASGIHLYAVGTWIQILAQRLGMHFGVSSRQLSLGVLGVFLVSTLVIWKLQGFALSLFRPLCTLLLRMGFKEWGARTAPGVPLLVTLGVECLLTQRSGLSPGALHYYLAVGGSLVAFSGPASARSPFRTHLEMAVFSWIPIACWDLLKDGLVSPMTPFLSLLTVPFLSLGLFPIAVGASIFSSEIPGPMLKVCESIFDGLLEFLDFLQKCTGGSLVMVVRHEATWFAFFATLGVHFARRLPLTRRPGSVPRGMRLVGVLLLGIGTFLVRVHGPHPSRVAQLDVGQGDSALTISKSRTELIDVGGSRALGPAEWIHSLARFGVTEVDGILLTHMDRDHTGGLPALLSVISVGCIEISRMHQREDAGKIWIEWLRTRVPETRILDSGCIQDSEVAWFQSRRHRSGGNAWMAGVVHELDPSAVYLALGDGDADQERQFLSHFEAEIPRVRQRIWKVGHHGSRFSSDLGVLQRLNPQEVWISVGRKNPYHHPSPETLSRLSLLPGRIRRTDREGDLVYPFDTPSKGPLSGFF